MVQCIQRGWLAGCVSHSVVLIPSGLSHEMHLNLRGLEKKSGEC